MSTKERTAQAALAEAAAAAGYAPSVHNTQPWRWRVTADALDLHAVRDRQLRAADPDGRLLTLSCGAALHHAVVALAAEGWTPAVSRLPDPDGADHLARITLTGKAPVTAAAMRRFQAVRLRHTDRAPETTVPVRDFAHAGTLAVGGGHDQAATYAVLYGPGDEPTDWLRAGEALSAGWLAATEEGVAVLPYSAVVELPAIRAALRHLIAAVGYPYLVLRLGTADPDTAGPPHTPRLAASRTVQVAGGSGAAG